MMIADAQVIDSAAIWLVKWDGSGIDTVIDTVIETLIDT
jgi:hypothetical protein